MISVFYDALWLKNRLDAGVVKIKDGEKGETMEELNARAQKSLDRKFGKVW